jgi:hypothetical protein
MRIRPSLIDDNIWHAMTNSGTNWELFSREENVSYLISINYKNIIIGTELAK